MYTKLNAMIVMHPMLNRNGGRHLKTQIAEHRNRINRNSNSQSMITKNRMSRNHDFKRNKIRP